jgi:putative transposase
MQTSKAEIASAVGMYYGGQPLDSIQRQLKQDYGDDVSESNLHNWIVRFSQEAIDQSKDYHPKGIGDIWIADETCIDVAGTKKQVWFWDVIDTKTRYLLASRVTTTRGTNDAKLLLEQAAQRAGKVPKRVLTDSLKAYIDGVELAFGSETKHIQSTPFSGVGGTAKIERFHGTLKDRTNVVRGFKNIEHARLLTEGWLVHYNFMKQHSAIGDIPPAQKLGDTPFKDWRDIVEHSHTTLSPSLRPRIAKEESPRPVLRDRTFRRRKF